MLDRTISERQLKKCSEILLIHKEELLWHLLED